MYYSSVVQSWISVELPVYSQHLSDITASVNTYSITNKALGVEVGGSQRFLPTSITL